MKTLYLDCGMGAAGDMLTAALLELLPNGDEFLSELNGLNIPGVAFLREPSVKCGIHGTHIAVKVNGEEETERAHGHSHEHGHEHSNSHEHECKHEHSHDSAHIHHHNGMHEIEHIIAKVKSHVLAVYSLIAEAESYVHDVPVTNVHFHEVGTMDAIADITAVCMLMDRLSPKEVIVSPVHVGSGYVQCAHGILPVPAPATAYILRDVPIYGGRIKSELCTPTGAALLKHFATKFGDMPVMKTEAIGYGMGKKDFPIANCIRALLGETEECSDTIVQLCCNLDDMTAEAIGFAEEQLFAAGALEVYTIPAQMKKSRPGILLSVLCQEKEKAKIIRLIFQHTTTLGIRENMSRRYILSRDVKNIKTELGEVHVKMSSGYGVVREKFEYEDIARIAREQGISLADVTKLISKEQKHHE